MTMPPNWILKRMAFAKLPTKNQIAALPTKERLRVGTICKDRRQRHHLRSLKKSRRLNLKHIKSLRLKPGDWTNEGEYVRMDEHYVYIKNMHGGISQTGLASESLLSLRHGTEAEFLEKKASYGKSMMEHIESLPRLKMD